MSRVIGSPTQVADWYLVREIGENIFWINEPAHVSFYIFRQGHRALFIDSGLGLSNELGQSLLHHLGISEFVVYCTHTHCDHVGLNHMAKSVFLCRIEWEKYLRQNEVAQLQGYYSLLKDQKKWPSGIVINDSIRNWKPSSFILDGDAFEFGPWRFRTFEVPGHTSGSLAFFELNQNNLFLGDMVYSGTLYFHLTDSSFGQYQCSLTRIKELIDKSDRPIGLWPSHNQIPLDSDFLGDVKTTIRAINKGTINHVRTWAKDAVFEEGVVYVDGLVKIVLRKDEYDGLQII